MNSFRKDKKELRTFGFDELTVNKLERLMSLDDYHEHLAAKHELQSMGNQILPVMHQLTHAKSEKVRKEAAKVIRQIASKDSLPVAIEMMEDPSWDVRWIAAELLIKIGRESLPPLLNRIMKNNHSYYLRQGLHHVLFELIRVDDPAELFELQHILLNGELRDSIPVKVSEIMHKDLLSV